MQHLLLLCSIAAASAYVTYDGPCPAVKPQDNFDFAAFQGTWYEMARYPSPHQQGLKGKCTVSEYFVFGSTGRVKNSQVVDGIKSYSEGDLTHYAPGIIMFSYTLRGVTQNSFLTILDTDYRSYSVAYSCKYFPYKNKHEVYAWILSRGTTMDDYAKAAVDRFLARCAVLDIGEFVANDYSEESCSASIVGPITAFRRT